MIKISYDQYDYIEEMCDRVNQKNESVNIGTPLYFSSVNNWPTIEQMEAMDLKNNLSQFLPFIMFWYTQKLDDKLLGNDLEEYRKSMKYIQELMKENIEFSE